ncbi:MAG: glutathione peroxidase [Pseudomonadota bacterium]
MVRLMGAVAMMAFAGVMMLAAPSRAGAPIDWSSLPLTGLAGEKFQGDTLRGRVVLLVNTASKCAFTPQYEGLEGLSDRYGGTGLTVLGVPSNEFGRQEPGSNEEIATFCSRNYGVSFPMLEKATVTGADAHPAFAWARAVGGRAAVPAWNFHKILIGRDGRFVAAFPSFIEPQSKRVVDAVEEALRTPSL